MENKETMKKYIRTKDGIYEVDFVDISTYYHTTRWSIIEKDQIIAQADTPEELCDLFIDEETKTIFHKHNGYVINWRTNLVYSLKGLIKEFHSVKGAIYTDKGLIYVAKMNDEGDLLLL